MEYLNTTKSITKRDIYFAIEMMVDDGAYYGDTDLEYLKDILDCDLAHLNFGDGCIHEGEWAEYQKQFAFDCGYIPDDSPLVALVNWDIWAESALIDYGSFTIDGVTFYYRM